MNRDDAKDILTRTPPLYVVTEENEYWVFNGRQTSPLQYQLELPDDTLEDFDDLDSCIDRLLEMTEGQEVIEFY